MLQCFSHSLANGWPGHRLVVNNKHHAAGTSPSDNRFHRSFLQIGPGVVKKTSLILCHYRWLIFVMLVLHVLTPAKSTSASPVLFSEMPQGWNWKKRIVTQCKRCMFPFPCNMGMHCPCGFTFSRGWFRAPNCRGPPHQPGCEAHIMKMPLASSRINLGVRTLTQNALKPPGDVFRIPASLGQKIWDVTFLLRFFQFTDRRTLPFQKAKIRWVHLPSGLPVPLLWKV